MQWEEGSIRFIRAWLINGSIMTAAVLCSLLMVEGTLRAIHYTYTPLRIQVINQSSEWRDYFKFWDEQAGVGNQEFVYDPFLIWRPRKGGLFANGPVWTLPTGRCIWSSFCGRTAVDLR